MIMQTIFRMYAVRRWDEERVIQGLAVLMCLAMVGMVVTPIIVGGQDAAAVVAVYLGSKYADAGEVSAGLLLGGASAIWLGLKAAELSAALALGLGVTGVGLVV
jgi:hypothetical protein